MKKLIIVFLCLYCIACQSKSEVAKSNLERRDIAQAQMDAAMKELDSGVPQKPVADPSKSAEYNRAIAESAKVQAEMYCDMNDDNTGINRDCTLMPPSLISDPVENKTSPKAAANNKPSPMRMTKYPIKDGYPVWFSNPSYDGYLGGVGVAKSQNGGYPAQRRVAISLAQADLSRTVSVVVNNELTSEKVVVDTKTRKHYKEKIDTMSRQDAGEYLQNPQVMDEWFNTATQELYIWVVLPK